MLNGYEQLLAAANAEIARLRALLDAHGITWETITDTERTS